MWQQEGYGFTLGWVEYDLVEVAGDSDTAILFTTGKDRPSNYIDPTALV